MHCAGHSLNLAIIKSCSIPPIRNCVDQVKEFTIWIKYSCEKGGSPQGYCAEKVSGRHQTVFNKKIVLPGG